ncbi:MAG: toxin-antitoxin system YwqK family antitoxin [Bacteroidota bacterium]
MSISTLSNYAQHTAADLHKTSSFSFSIPLKNNFNQSDSKTIHIEANGFIEGTQKGKVIFKAYVKKNKLDGIWISYHPNGQLLDSGMLSKGIPTGLWRVWDADGNLIKVRQYDADLYLRIKDDIKMNHPRLKKFAITSRYDKEGNTILKYLTSDYSFNISSRPNYNTLESLVNSNSSNILSYSPAFIACAHEGIFLNYSKNKIIIDSGYYKNGLMDGPWIHRDPETYSAEKGSYKNGLKIDVWKKYDASGKLSYMSYYSSEGVLQWEKKR